MNLMSYLQFLEPMQDQFGRIYSTMSGVIAVVLVLWIINLVAGLIQRTYAIGKAFGGFYRNYVHRHLKSILSQIFGMLRRTTSQTTV